MKGLRNDNNSMVGEKYNSMIAVKKEQQQHITIMGESDEHELCTVDVPLEDQADGIPSEMLMAMACSSLENLIPGANPGAFRFKNEFGQYIRPDSRVFPGTRVHLVPTKGTEIAVDAYEEERKVAPPAAVGYRGSTILPMEQYEGWGDGPSRIRPASAISLQSLSKYSSAPRLVVDKKYVDDEIHPCHCTIVMPDETEYSHGFPRAFGVASLTALIRICEIHGLSDMEFFLYNDAAGDAKTIWLRPGGRYYLKKK